MHHIRTGMLRNKVHNFTKISRRQDNDIHTSRVLSQALKRWVCPQLRNSPHTAVYRSKGRCTWSFGFRQFFIFNSLHPRDIYQSGQPVVMGSTSVVVVVVSAGFCRTANKKGTLLVTLQLLLRDNTKKCGSNYS